MNSETNTAPLTGDNATFEGDDPNAGGYIMLMSTEAIADEARILAGGTWVLASLPGGAPRPSVVLTTEAIAASVATLAGGEWALSALPAPRKLYI